MLSYMSASPTPGRGQYVRQVESKGNKVEQHFGNEVNGDDIGLTKRLNLSDPFWIYQTLSRINFYNFFNQILLRFYFLTFRDCIVGTKEK